MDQYAVIGNPIHHSKSPLIHQLFAQQTNQAIEYRALLSPLDKFNQTAQAFVSSGGKGFNITVPFKEAAYALADVVSFRAKKAQAVNTMVVGKDNKLYGDNTDGVGFVRDTLQNQKGTLTGKKILILGAGGAVRGLLQPLLAETPALVCIANRTKNKAVQLAMEFADLGAINALGLNELKQQQFDWVINAASLGLNNHSLDLPAALLTPTTWCYDLVYADKVTAFNQWALQHGAARVMDGLGMLVEQAAEAFFLWRNVRPNTLHVIKALQEKLLG